MKRLANRLIRAVLYVLALFPPVSIVFGWLTVNLLFGIAVFLIEIVCLALIALLPAYIGSYREYEVVTYEQTRSSDPNPDRETVRETKHEGHRFPLRLACDIAFFIVSALMVFFLPQTLFVGGSIFRKIFFILILLVLQLIAAKDIPAQVNLWEDIPGIFVGAVGYLILSIFLQFTSKDVSTLQTLSSVCSVAYLFMGALALNKQSISLSMSAHSGESMRIPKLIVIRNRRIVLTFAGIVTVVSLIEPVRKLFVWLAAKLGAFFTKILGLNFAPVDAPSPMPMATMMEPVEALNTEMAEGAAEMGLLSKIFVYGFLLLVAVGFVWVVFDSIKKLTDKLTKWLEKLAGNVSEGFYDEKEELMSADEMRDHVRNSLISGIKGFFKRETPWRDLSGREKARRLLALTYKKRVRGINHLASKTAKETIVSADLPEHKKETFYKAYDAARYSDSEISGEDMDALKKDLRL